MRLTLFSLSLTILIINLLHFKIETQGCEASYEFEGFGVNLGSVQSFQESKDLTITIQRVLDTVYDDLGIRFFRTHYNPDFSPSPDVYEIPSSTEYHAAWNELHSQLSSYSNISLMVSISSPPAHMKQQATQSLPREKEQAYLDFILSINQQMEDRFDLKVERVSPINEPLTGIPLATLTNNTFMNPKQLCRMVKDFNNPIVSLCPEKSFYWTSIYYANFLNGTDNEDRTTCIDSCDIIATHGYSWFVDLEPPIDDLSNNFKLYYDHKQYDRRTTKPIWQTEVCSKLNDITSVTNEMTEAVDFAINIGNFLGSMCVQRYYYYNMFTWGPSGESLIWGTNESDEIPVLRFPKKYFAFRHFTTASRTWPVNIADCSPSTFFGTFCTQFGSSRAVFTNNLDESVPLTWYGVGACKVGSVFCTTKDEDWSSSGTTGQNAQNQTINIAPPKSICSCELEEPTEPEDLNSGSTGQTYFSHINSYLLISIISFAIIINHNDSL